MATDQLRPGPRSRGRPPPVLTLTGLGHVRRPPRHDSRSLLYGDLGRAGGPGDRTERTEQAARIFDVAESGASANDGAIGYSQRAWRRSQSPDLVGDLGLVGEASLDEDSTGRTTSPQ